MFGGVAMPYMLSHCIFGRSHQEVLLNFTTHFSFSIKAQNNVTPADGFAFFIASLQYHIPNVADGSGIGLAAENLVKDSTENLFVAVEFDTFHNIEWDPENDHVGININSLVSNATVTWDSSVMDGKMMDAWINYKSSSKIYMFPSQDLEVAGNKKGNINTGLAVGFTVGSCISIGGLCLIFLFLKKMNEGVKDELLGIQSMNNEFEPVTALQEPRRKLSLNWFKQPITLQTDRSLEREGLVLFTGDFLKDLNSEVAVKRISTTSRQGIKEYASEVMVSSRLRQRSLVQLIGWCHEKKDLLLVYEYMPNGSLDSHLFKGERLLTRTERYKIVQGLASSLHYLHFECEPCVLHRDIKASNVLLYSSFNAKLGDFGLARIVDLGKALQSTKLGRTFGYMAPEYASTGRASQETDV
ncbi:hypothetical protein REPUB_Repub04eG0092000 [Reevesia pubescens]